MMRLGRKGAGDLGPTPKDDMPDGRDVFFYGLFMDMGALRAKGVQPTHEQIVTVPDHAVRLRAKAVLLRAPGHVATGVLARITDTDFRTLYDHQTDYHEVRLTVLTQAGQPVPAVTMVHRDPDRVGPADPAYTVRWQELTGRLGTGAGSR